MLVRLTRALEERPRRRELLLAVVRDAEHQLSIARILELAFVDTALNGRDRGGPVLALHLHFAQANERVPARRHFSGACERRNGLLILASRNPTIRELLVELVVEVDDFLLHRSLEGLGSAIGNIVEQQQI